MPPVKVLWKDEEPVVIEEAQTVRELKNALEDEIDLTIPDNWDLSRYGITLPAQHEAKLSDYLDEGESFLPLRLTKCDAEDKDEKGRKIEPKGTKTRYIVRGKEDKFEILEVLRNDFVVKLHKKHKVGGLKFGDEILGVVQKIRRNADGKRKVQFNVFQLDREGLILLRPYEEDPVLCNVHMVENKGGVMMETKLESKDAMEWDEENIMSPYEKESMRIQYLQTLFQAIDAGTSIASVAMGV